MGKKIIIIDDEPGYIRNIQSFLSFYGYTCIGASNGQDGLRKIEEEKPDLMLLDILMPDMDGYTMLHEIKRRKINIKCIVITAKGRLKDLFEVEKIDRFLTKPFDLADLKTVVEELLGNDGTSEENLHTAEEIAPEDDIGIKKTIIVIDDERPLAESIKNYLDLHEYDTHVAYSGEEGLTAISLYTPDLIITDIIMPRMDGYSMIKEFRKRNRETPIIVMTAKEKLQDFIEVEGITAMLIKPFAMDELGQKIAEILAQKE